MKGHFTGPASLKIYQPKPIALCSQEAQKKKINTAKLAFKSVSNKPKLSSVFNSLSLLTSFFFLFFVSIFSIFISMHVVTTLVYILAFMYLHRL